MSVKLGVNIDHIATLRQARKASDPDPLSAAKVARSAGADMIVAHLRGDRRHIQEEDLVEIRRQLKAPLHLEMAASKEMVQFALRLKPHSVCIVPESPKEVTTQGGLKIDSDGNKNLHEAIESLKKAGIGVSLFVDPDPIPVRMAFKLGADTVELCTTEFARSSGKLRQKEELERLELAAYLAQELGLEVHAGHDLAYDNALAIAKIPGMECLNIGFSIISRAMFTGLRQAVAEMKAILKKA